MEAKLYLSDVGGEGEGLKLKESCYRIRDLSFASLHF